MNNHKLDAKWYHALLQSISLVLRLKNKIAEAKSYTVIVPNHKEIAVGTFQSILKQAGITKEELESYIK